MARLTKAEKAKRIAANRRKQRKATKAWSSPMLVQTSKESGGKRKGKKMRRAATEYRSSTLVRADIERVLDIDQDALAHVNATGRVKMLTYRRDS